MSPHCSRSASWTASKHQSAVHLALANRTDPARLPPAACEESHTVPWEPPLSLALQLWDGFLQGSCVRMGSAVRYLTPGPTPTQALQRFHIHPSFNLAICGGLEDDKFKLGIQIVLGDWRDDRSEGRGRAWLKSLSFFTLNKWV
jgi:hypothetical protein